MYISFLIFGNEKKNICRTVIRYLFIFLSLSFSLIYYCCCYYYYFFTISNSSWYSKVERRSNCRLLIVCSTNSIRWETEMGGRHRDRKMVIFRNSNCRRGSRSETFNQRELICCIKLVSISWIHFLVFVWIWANRFVSEVVFVWFILACIYRDWSSKPDNSHFFCCLLISRGIHVDICFSIGTFVSMRASGWMDFELVLLEFAFETPFNFLFASLLSSPVAILQSFGLDAATGLMKPPRPMEPVNRSDGLLIHSHRFCCPFEVVAQVDEVWTGRSATRNLYCWSGRFDLIDLLLVRPIIILIITSSLLNVTERLLFRCCCFVLVNERAVVDADWC